MEDELGGISGRVPELFLAPLVNAAYEAPACHEAAGLDERRHAFVLGRIECLEAPPSPVLRDPQAPISLQALLVDFTVPPELPEPVQEAGRPARHAASRSSTPARPGRGCRELASCPRQQGRVTYDEVACRRTARG